MRLWVWRHIRLELPDDWEMLQFSRNPHAGRCAFADRYQFRLEMSWQALSGPPNMDRLVSDYLSKLKLDGTMPDAVRADQAPWVGIRDCQAGILTSRLSRHFPAERCLVEVVFLWPEGEDAAVQEQILESIGPEPDWPGGLRRWRAFGLDLLATGSLVLSECEVEPALARLAFSDERTGQQETFRRLGMVAEWLKGSVRDWLVNQKHRDVELTAETMADIRGHTIEGASAVHKPGIARKASRYECAAWLCPADGRLYYVSATGTGTGKGTELAGTRLACCEQMALQR